MRRVILILVLFCSCCVGEPCPDGRALANAGDCVPGCMLTDGRGPSYGTPVFDDVGIFTGECVP